MRSSGVAQHVAEGVADAAAARASAPGGASCAGFIRTRATSIATKLSALSGEAERDARQSAMTMPAIAGPVIRAEWTRTLLRPTALTTRSGPTISITKPAAPGCRPRGRGRGGRSAAKTIQASATPVAARAKRSERRDGHPGLADDQQLALVEAVGERAAEGAEEEDAAELQGGRDADGDAGAGEAEDQPELGDDLHPVAGQRDDLPAEVEAVVGDLRVRRRTCAGRRSTALLLEHPLEDLRGALERGHVVVGKVLHAAREVGVLALAQALQQRPPLGGGGDDRAAAVGRDRRCA